MALERLEQPPLSLEASAQAYMLLETEAVEDHLRTQVGATDQPTLLKTVKRIDFATFTRWVWNQTEYEAHAQHGPLLVQIEPGSPLLTTFYDDWSLVDGGVLVASQTSLDQVLAHLRAVLFVQLPDGAKTRFRFQETQALSSVLRALSPDRAAGLLGPLSTLVWRENLGPTEYQWWRYTQPHPASPSSGPFQFTHRELAAIDHYLAEHRLSVQVALTREAPHSFQDNPRKQTVEWMKQLEQWGFQRHSDVAAGLDVFRHDSFAANALRVTQTLAQTDVTPGARVTQAINELHGQGT